MACQWGPVLRARCAVRCADEVGPADWSDTSGRGVLRWEWGACCSDGLVFGPLPSSRYCLNVRYSVPVEGLDELRLFDYSATRDEYSYTSYDPAAMQSGFQVGRR